MSSWASLWSMIDTPNWPRIHSPGFPHPPDALYLVMRVTPSRIDLVDEDSGWGVQETLEW
jgi:hypothetical protein